MQQLLDKNIFLVSSACTPVFTGVFYFAVAIFVKKFMTKQVVELPLSLFKKIERVLDKLDQSDELIDENEARKLLGKKGKVLTAGSIYNMRHNGIIPPSFYTVGVNGSVFYYKNKLMGICSESEKLQIIQSKISLKK